MQPKRDNNNRDTRFRYDANGRQRGLDWTTRGLDTNPVDPIVDAPTPLGEKAAKA